MIKIDLTKFYRFNNLPTGTYTIKSQSIGTGIYTKSNKSTGVSYTKVATYSLSVEAGTYYSDNIGDIYLKTETAPTSNNDYVAYVSGGSGTVTWKSGYSSPLQNVTKIYVWCNWADCYFTLNNTDYHFTSATTGYTHATEVTLSQNSNIKLYGCID